MRRAARPSPVAWCRPLRAVQMRRPDRSRDGTSPPPEPPIGGRRRRDLVFALPFRVLTRPLPINAHGARPETTSHFRCGSKGVGPPLTGANPNYGVDGADPHLAVADLAGASGLDDDIDHLVDGGVIDNDLYTHLRHEVDGVLGASVHLGVTLLAPVALDLADGHSENTRLFQARLDVFERERLDDRSNQLHIPLSLRAVTGQYRTAATGDRGEVVSGFSMLRLLDAGRLILRIKT